MRKANHCVVALGLAVVLLFAGGLFALLKLRFEAGDIYPPYSSLRSDPLGTRALFDSLERMPGLAVARNFTHPVKLPSEASTLILAGLDRDAFDGSEREMNALQRFVTNGGRAVIMLTAVKPNRGPDETAPSRPCDKDHPTPSPDDENSVHREQTRMVSLQSNWGFKLETPPLASAQGEARREPGSSPALPVAIVWHSGLVVVPDHPGWRVLYRFEGRPVVMERRLGRGSIFLATDSYLISNEALRNHRQPALLSRMAGSNRTVFFDETHLGLHHQPGISNLIRRYRLHGLIVGLMMLAGLYIWRNGRSFLPAPPDASDEGFRLAYQDTDLALVGLIGRHLPDDRLLGTCVAAYEQTLIRPGADMTAKLARIQQLAAGTDQDLVQTYQSICRILARRSSQ